MRSRLVTGGGPDNLLPSISRLLKQAGSLENAQTVDISSIARQPVFQDEAWKEAISDFLRWSGSTLAPEGSASVYELLLCYGKAGALALYNAFREHLLRRGGPPANAERKLAAVRTIASMASHWLRQTDWDLDDARRLTPEDFAAAAAESGAISLSPELSKRLRNVLSRVHPDLSAPDFVERLVAEKVAELEAEEKGSPFGPKTARQDAAGEEEPEAERPVSAPPRSLFTTAPTVRSLWKKAPEEPAAPPGRVPPGSKLPPRRF